MIVNLLKRLESSVAAFRLTLAKLERFCAETLGKIDTFQARGVDPGVLDVSTDFDEAEPDEEDTLPEPDDARIGGKIQIRLEDMDVVLWRHDLEADLLVIRELLGEMRKITPGDDAKLQHLRTQIHSKLGSPINPGNKKVLIFTAFADTANYLYEQLAGPLQKAHQIHTGRVTGNGPPASTLKRAYDFQSLLTLFSPRSKSKHQILPHEPGEIDVLIGTDCISEGQNLQDCDTVINYDIHWNPVRIIQRFGRVDRIGSPNACIQLVNYWPDITLDEYINLKERVESRMVIADVTATGDDNPLSQQSNDIAYRREQLRRLQDEVIEMEDLKTGVSITDLGLNDFRMDLLHYVKQNGELGSIPNGMHAVVPADPARGLPPGVIFTLRNRNPGVNIQQQNRLHPFYLVYVARDGRVVSNHTEVKQLLDLARTACKGRDLPIVAACRQFNEATRDGRDMRVYSDMLDQAIRSIVAVQDERDIDSLFSGGKTTALMKTVAHHHGRGDHVLVVNHASDTRYTQEECICSHEMKAMPCIKRSELVGLQDTPEFKSCKVVCIDEGHFFPDLFEFCLECADIHDKEVYIAALNGDYKRICFAEISKIIGVADSITKLNAICYKCSDSNENAIFSKKKNETAPVVGGAETYEAVCRRHFI